MDEKNYLNVDVIPCCDKIMLDVEIKVNADSTFVKCYEKALATKEHTCFRSSGGPVIDGVVFSGKHAKTSSFPRNKYAYDEVDEFLKEFNDFLGIAYGFYNAEMAMRAAKQLEEKKQAEEAAKELEELKKRFNK